MICGNIWIDCGWIEGKGRAVVARQFLPELFQIERAPAEHYSPEDFQRIDETPLGPIQFADPKTHGNGSHGGFTSYGLASMCNHSDSEPNARVRWEQDERGCWWSILETTETIVAGAEIKIVYTNIEARYYAGHERWQP